MNIKGNIVTKDEIDMSNGIIYEGDEEEGPLNLPNAMEITDKVIEILEYMNTDQMKLLKSTNQQVYEETLEEKFNEFALRYYSMFKMIISGADLDPLMQMLQTINTVNMGLKSAEDGEQDVGKYLTKFLPDNLLNQNQNKKKKNKKNRK